MSIADDLREKLLDEFRKTADSDRVYPTDKPWPIGVLGNRGDPNTILALPLAEAFANVFSGFVTGQAKVIESAVDVLIELDEENTNFFIIKNTNPENEAISVRLIGAKESTHAFVHNGSDSGHVIFIKSSYSLGGSWSDGAALNAGKTAHLFCIYIDPDTVFPMWARWDTIGGGSSDEPVDWADIINKPTVFPPESHTQDISTINDLQNVLNDKAALIHTHGISDVTGLQSALDGKSNTSHNHDHNNLSGLDVGDYQHLSQLQKTDLTDGGDSSLHYHSADRNRANHSGTQAISTVSGLQDALDNKQPLNSKLTAISNLSVTSGNFIVGNGSTFVSRKLQNSDLPAIAITDTFVVASQSAMLALSAAERGDVAVRTDLNKSFILKGDNPASLPDWQELLSPTDAVLSVDGRTGVVSLSDKYQPLDTDLTTIAALTHSNRHVMVSNGSSWTRRALVEADLPSLSISKITNLQTALDSKEPAITGIANKVLSIAAGGTGVKTGSISDNGTVVSFEKAFIGNSLSAGIRHYHDVYLYSNLNSADTGILKIVMPKGWTNTFQRITIKGYNYAGSQGAWECIIGGYNYTTGWHNYSAEIRGSAPFSTVRLGYDGSKCVILLGTTNTEWRYAKVAISDMLVGGSIYNWETGWSASIITSETGLTKIVAPTVNSGVSADWNALINKPTTFTPSAHSHAWNDITGKPSVFTPSAHGLVSSTHTVSGLTAGHVLKALSATTYGFAAITWYEIMGKPSVFTPVDHWHPWEEITGKPIGPERSLSITTAGWVTIATCATGRAYGEFHVYDSTNGRHNFTKIIASTSYGVNNVSVIGGNRFSTRSIAHVRILYNTSDRTYGGAKLQVYCENPTFTLYVKQFLSQEFTNWKSWNNATPVAEGTPTGWAQDDSTYLRDITNPNYSFVAGGARIEGKLTGCSSLEIWEHSYLGNNLNVGGLLSFMYDNNYVTFARRNASNTVDLLNIAKISGNRVVMSRRNVGNWTTISRPGGIHLINLNDYPGVTRFNLVATSGDVVIGFYNGVIGDEIFVKCYNYNNPRILSGSDGTNWTVHDGQFFHFTCEGSATRKWGSNQYTANLWMKW